MIDEAAGASVYTDFQGLARLRAAAGQQTPEAMRETARQFEALFVQTMLKAMRDASQDGGLFDSDKTDFYRDIHDRQLALEIVKGRGLGIANMLMHSLAGGSAQPGAPLPSQDVPRDAVTSSPLSQETQPSAPLVSLSAAPSPLIPLTDATPRPVIDRSEPVTAAPRTDWQPVDAEAFVRDLLPLARAGAARLGVSPDVLVAQAALETGWGQKMIRHGDGRNSFNLFGIKADGRWQGDRATVTTLEYTGGIARQERAAFRAYGSLEESVNDYVEFIRGNPRYEQALESPRNSMAYLRGLKEGGYATDPDYVEKIRSIMDGEVFVRMTGQLAYAGQVSSGAAGP